MRVIRDEPVKKTPTPTSHVVGCVAVIIAVLLTFIAVAWICAGAISSNGGI